MNVEFGMAVARQSSLCLDRFPLSRNLYVRTHVNFRRVNKIEAAYGRSHVNAKVETLAQL